MSIIGYDKSKTFEKHFYKDIFEFSIIVEDKSIFEDIQEFISFEVGSKPNVVYDTIRIVFKDKTKLDSNDRILAEKGHRITIHGGTPNQQVYGKKVVTQEKTIYRIPLNDEYILQNKERDFYVLYGGNKGKEENLYRIIREIYYRKSLALGWIAMHSAAVADRQGRCILLSGEKASGKTTLLCNLLASNKFSLIDNDRLLMGVSRNGMLQAHSMSSTINVGYGTMRIYPERFNNLECPTAAMTTDKKRYSRKEFIEQFGCMAITTGIAKSIIFPAIRKDSTTRLTKYDTHQTMVKILSAIETFDNNEHPDWLGISNVSEEQYSKNVQIIVKAMIKALPGFELEFGYEKISDSIIDEIEIRGI